MGHPIQEWEDWPMDFEQENGEMFSQLPLSEAFHKELDNGLRVWMCPQKHLHRLGIGLYIRIGSRFEKAQLSGVSHFLEHILFRGNQRYPSSMELNRAIESWGGSFNGYTSQEVMQIYGTFHPRFLQEGVQFLSDFINQPSFEGIELERTIILEERLEDVNEDGHDLEVNDLIRKELWEGLSLGQKVIGTAGTVKRMKQEDLKAAFETHFGLKNVLLCLTGRFDPSEALREIQSSFGKLPAGQCCTPEGVPSNYADLPKTSFVYQDDNQVDLQLSFLGPAPTHDDFPAILLASRILDDGMSSRLWQKVVEEKGLCYEIWCEIDQAHDHSKLDMGASVAPEKAIVLVENIIGEVIKLREQGPTREEFEMVKRRCRYQLEFLLDEVDELNDKSGVAALYHRNLNLEEWWKKLHTYSIDQCMLYWQSFFHPSRCVLAAVGPLSKTKKRAIRERIQSM